MNKKDEFKNFVKKNPSLIKHVKDGSMSWQKYYEIYDMYGEDENVWKDYITKEKMNTEQIFVQHVLTFVHGCFILYSIGRCD